MGVESIAVLGTGIMGVGIAQVAARGGYQVILRDLQMSLVQKGISEIEDSLQMQVNQGQLSAAKKDQVMKRITGVTDLAHIRDVDMVIEAIIEDISVKKQVFAELDSLCKEEAILATNTSSLSITEIASATKRPARVIGMHFFNPVSATGLVEVIRGLETSASTVDKTTTVVKNMGKESITVELESPGFVVNRILIPMINEAIWVLGERLASKEDIDKAMKLGTGMPSGPLEMADAIGLDTLYSVILVLYQEFKDPKYRPHPLLSTLVRAGHLGQKTGTGFYAYEKQL